MRRRLQTTELLCWRGRGLRTWGLLRKPQRNGKLEIAKDWVEKHRAVPKMASMPKSLKKPKMPVRLLIELLFCSRKW